MDLTAISSLALLQGLTEFLPISSSAHLILVPALLGWPDQGVAFDVAVHLGTLIAVVTYFRDDVVALTAAWWRSIRHRESTDESRLAWGVVIATAPAALVGLSMRDLIAEYLRSPLVIAATTIGFGLLLLVADRIGSRSRDERALGIRDYLLIGCAQALALIPGTSRSGITMTASLLLGQTRESAARVSFLLSMPIILLSGIGVSGDLVSSAAPVDWLALALGTVLAAVSAFACIYLFMTWITRIGMLPFVIYRLLLGALLLWVFV